MSSRKVYNKKILELLEVFFDRNKDLRFIQGLWALGIINRDKDGNIEDKFYEESEDTYYKIPEEGLAEVPSTAEECLAKIEEACQYAINDYDNNSYLNSPDTIIGESAMAERISELISTFKNSKR